jgi:hypothetical protein
MTNSDPAGLGFRNCINVSSCVCNAFFYSFHSRRVLLRPTTPQHVQDAP